MLTRKLTAMTIASLILASCQISTDLTDSNPNRLGDNASPAQPAELTGQWLSDSLLVSWSDQSENETYFEVSYRVDLGQWHNSFFAQPNAEFLEIRNLPYTESIELKVRSGNSYGESDWLIGLLSSNDNDPSEQDSTEEDSADNEISVEENDSDSESDITPVASELTAPEHGATVPQQPLTLQFTDAGRMWLDVGTTPRGDELLSTAITGTKHVLNNLPASGTLYITLWTYLDDAWQFSEYSVVIAGDTQPETSDPETDSEQPTFTSTPGQVTYHALDYSGAEGVQLYAGRDSGEGVDLVVLAEGYTQAQLSQFVRDAEQLIDTAFDFHPLNKHLPAWNIHLLSLASNESGADHAVAQGDLVDTRFGANYWCGNTERLLCINASSVKTAVAQYVPQYDEILVLVNSSKYGGAGYSSGIATASLASAVVNLIRHEVAHSFAGLADEYSYGRSTAPSSEPRGANATLETNPANLKWRHWIDDVNSVVLNEGDDVGLFEGAVYVSQGAYRPTRNSLMRSLGQPFFEVNSEAWSLAVYKHIKPILSTVPEVGAVSMQLGDAQWFALESLYGAQEVSVQWSLNGQPISPDAENPFALQFTATDSGNYFLTATVTDNTGVIRRDLTTTARQTLQWSLNIQ